MIETTLDERLQNVERPISMKAAAEMILEDHGGPMKATDITKIALDKGMIKNTGKTPEATMQAQLSVAAKKEQTFVRTAPGTYGLIGRDHKGQVAAGGGVAAPPKPDDEGDGIGMIKKALHL